MNFIGIELPLSCQKYPVSIECRFKIEHYIYPDFHNSSIIG